MGTRTTIKLLIAMLLIAVAIGTYAYPGLPERIATHWNASGVADGYSDKFWGVFLMPLVMAVLAVFYVLIPVIDPLRRNIESFRRHYNLFWVAVIGFMLYVFILSVAFNKGIEFDFGRALLPGLVILLWAAAVLIQHAKRSWFVGIRTPWTMSDDVVWEKTHALGGRLFKAAAILSLGGLLFDGATAFWFVIVPILLATAIAVVYSFVLYRRLH